MVSKALLHIQRDGFAVLEGIVPSDDCPRIRESLLNTVEQYGGQFESPEQIGYIPSVVNLDQSFAAYLADDRLLRVVEGLLGPQVRISFTSATINFPGNERLSWHADWPFNQNNGTYIPAPYPDQVIHLTTLWMLSPFSDENGGTLIVPRSHLQRSNPTVHGRFVQPYSDEVQVNGSAGSVLVMDSRMWHATAANLSVEPRVALAVRYAPWWLNLDVLRPGRQRDSVSSADEESHNLVPSIDRAAFDTLPDKVQRLYAHWVV